VVISKIGVYECAYQDHAVFRKQLKTHFFTSAFNVQLLLGFRLILYSVCDSVMHLCPFCNRHTINLLDDADADDDDDDDDTVILTSLQLGESGVHRGWPEVACFSADGHQHDGADVRQERVLESHFVDCSTATLFTSMLMTLKRGTVRPSLMERSQVK